MHPYGLYVLFIGSWLALALIFLGSQGQAPDGRGAHGQIGEISRGLRGATVTVRDGRLLEISTVSMGIQSVSMRIQLGYDTIGIGDNGIDASNNFI